MKRSHIYQHPSLVGHGSLAYDAKYNRLSTYQVMNVSEHSSSAILGRKFTSDGEVQLQKRSLDNHESEMWFRECQSLIKRQKDNDTESELHVVAGDNRHSWSLLSSKLGHFLAFFKDSMGRVHSYLLKRISDIWDFVNKLLLRVRINIEVIMFFVIIRMFWTT